MAQGRFPSRTEAGFEPGTGHPSSLPENATSLPPFTSCNSQRRGVRWMKLVLVVTLVAAITVPTGILGLTDNFAERDGASHTLVFNVHGATPGGQPTIPQTSGPGIFVQWTLCLANNSLVPGNYGCTFNDAPEEMAWDPLTGDMYVTNYGSNGVYGGSSNVLIVNGTSDAVVASSAVGKGPCADTYDPLNHEVYVANCNTDHRVSTLDGATGTNLGNISVGYEPDAIAVDTANGEVYVANYNGTSTADSNVTVIDGATDKTIGSVAVGVSPTGVAYDGATGDFYVSNYLSNNVSVINGTTNKVVTAYSLPDSPGGEWSPMTYDSANRELYIGGSTCGCLMVVDATNGTVAATIQLGVYLSGVGPVAIDPNTGNILVLMPGSAPSLGNVTVINGSTNVVLGNVTMPGSNVDGLAFDNTTGDAYVSTYDTGSLSILSPGTGYALTFRESGLPSGTAWSVTANGVPKGGNSSSLWFDEPNGTYSFAVGNIPGYTVTPSSGSVTVKGASVSQAISFTPVAATTYPVTFTESSLPAGTSWSVTLGGSTRSTTAGTIAFNETNGTYAYTVGAVSGYTASPASGSVSVKGAPGSQTITFSSVPLSRYAVTFAETGLATGTAWSVKLNSTTYNSTGSTVQFLEFNGTYAYSVGAVSGYSASPISGSVTVNGATQNIAITFTSVTATIYPVTFTETGLAAGTSWSVTLSGTTNSSTSATIGFTEKNGTYSYTVAGVSGYTASPTAGTEIVNGGGGTQAITFTPNPPGQYSVLFTETGLPSGTAWSVTLGTTTYSSVGTTVLFTETNGSYTYTVGSVPGYVASPSTGSATINGVSQTLTVAFSPTSVPTYAVTFRESGLPSGTSWSVTLNGVQKSGAGTLSFTEPNGSYTYVVGTVAGYTATPASGSFTVNGAAVGTAITFAALPPGQYSVLFVESGLPAGTNWSVTFGSTVSSSTTNMIAFTVPNGTYAYTVGAVSGYTATPSSGNVAVKGATQTVTTTFTRLPAGSFTVTFSEAGLPSGTNWSVTLAGKTNSATGVTIWFAEKNGSYLYTVTAPTGYSATPSSGSLSVSGNAVSQSVTFSPNPPPGRTEYSVAFVESGLPSGTAWSVTLNGSTQSSTTTTLTFQEVNGSYDFSVGPMSGYTVSPASGAVKVIGDATGQALTFTSSSTSNGTTSPAPGFLGLPGYDGYLLIGVVVAAVATVLGVMLLRGRRKAPPSKEMGTRNKHVSDGTYQPLGR